MSQGQKPKCRNPECRVAETGKCVEGHSLEECTHFLGMVADGPEDGVEEGEEGVDELGVRLPVEPPKPRRQVLLPGALHLSVDDASAIVRQSPTRVIALVGPSDAGKTTLASFCYDSFLWGRRGAFSFVGSRTLHGFEASCHKNRAASKRVSPKTDHTPLGIGLVYLHLHLNSPDGFLHLLFAERSGEKYTDIVSDIRIAKMLPELKRADCVTLVVDGKKLADLGERHNTISDARHTARALIDTGVPTGRQRLAVVLTKDDVGLQSARQAVIHAEFEGLFGQITRLCEGSFHSIQSFITAASPSHPDIPRYQGLDQLLEYWCLPPPSIAIEKQRPSPELSRSFWHV